VHGVCSKFASSCKHPITRAGTAGDLGQLVINRAVKIFNTRLPLEYTV